MLKDLAKKCFLRDGLIALLITVLVGSLSLILLEPKVGIDDANITMNYAENIANGYGYVYYVGGERVEGSSSALWTALTAVVFLFSSQAEEWLLVICGSITIAILWLTIMTSRRFLKLAGLESNSAPLLTGLIFLLFPAFFGWTIWSFMDLGLWILLISGMFSLMVSIIQTSSPKGSLGRNKSMTFVLLTALVTLARPEGIVVAIGMIAFLFFLAKRWPERRSHLALTYYSSLAAIVSFGGIIALRLWYFGYPQPNTFYAKVSTNYGDQLVQGLIYTASYFLAPPNLLLFVLAGCAPVAVALRSASGDSRTIEGGRFFAAWLAVASFVFGALAVYSALGGDHFGSHRFYQIFIPTVLPAAIVSVETIRIALISKRMGFPLRYATLAMLTCFPLLIIAVPWASFMSNKGDLANEFRIAERGREMGRILNEFPGQPSVAVVPAGGISMTYDGPILDLMGLNWVSMAHQGRNFYRRPKNHSGFNRDVFYSSPPDLVHPVFFKCDEKKYSSKKFFRIVLDGLFEDEEFQRSYDFVCWRGLAFYLNKDFSLPQGVVNN